MSQTERGLPGVTRVDAKLFPCRLTEHEFVRVDSGLPPRGTVPLGGFLSLRVVSMSARACGRYVVLAFSMW